MLAWDRGRGTWEATWECQGTRYVEADREAATALRRCLIAARKQVLDHIGSRTTGP